MLVFDRWHHIRVQARLVRVAPIFLRDAEPLFRVVRRVCVFEGVELLAEVERCFELELAVVNQSAIVGIQKALILLVGQIVLLVLVGIIGIEKFEAACRCALWGPHRPAAYELERGAVIEGGVHKYSNRPVFAEGAHDPPVVVAAKTWIAGRWSQLGRTLEVDTVCDGSECLHV